LVLSVRGDARDRGMPMARARAVGRCMVAVGVVVFVNERDM